MISTLEEIEAWLGAPLPAAYRAYLENHPEDVSASDLVLLFGRRSFIELNEAYEVKKYCPGFFAIGNDNDMALILPLLGAPVYWVDAGAMTFDCFHKVADDFDKWLALGCPLPDDEDDDQWAVSPTETVLVYLESRPTDLKSLLKIKECLRIGTSIGELKRMLDSIPCPIATNFTYALARMRCVQANAVEPCLGIRLASDPSVSLPATPALPKKRGNG